MSDTNVGMVYLEITNEWHGSISTGFMPRYRMITEDGEVIDDKIANWVKAITECAEYFGEMNVGWKIRDMRPHSPMYYKTLEKNKTPS